MDRPYRHSLRLKEWDYSSPGAYFVTICTKDRKPFLGRIEYDEGRLEMNARMRLSPVGEVCQNTMLRVMSSSPNVFLDAYVIMPNHVHLLLTLLDGLNTNGGEFSNVSKMVGLFKRSVTVQARSLFSDTQLWQKSFYDHIVRSERERDAILEYIVENPQRWALDKYHIS